VIWLGHASVDIRMGGTRLVTDPILRNRVAHLQRHGGTAAVDGGMMNAVLISHLHHDHLDLPSIKLLATGTPLILPRGAARLVATAAPGEIIEMSPGDEVMIDGVRITAVPAEHHSGRLLSRVKGAPLGFVMERADRVVYFPGDTDLHPVMADLPAPDVALLPIWGWGRTIGTGHLDPGRAAQAAAMLRARSVLPVHWGTFAPVGLRRSAPGWIGRPGEAFTEAMARHAPETLLHLVRPGPAPVAIAPARPSR
jgi:L-ascorbate metabolism protein UlaG (beta-lactamase superfamily)